MIRGPLAALLAAALGALAATGCGSKGGGGGGSGTSVAAATSASIASDKTPPEIVVTDPQRGAFLPPGRVHVAGKVTDVGSGVASFTVQGTNVPLAANGDFSIAITVDEGVSSIVMLATDKAGNQTERSLSVETGTYLPATALVTEAFAGRINNAGLRVMEKVAAAEIAAIQSTIGAQLKAANPIFSAYSIDVSIDAVSFGTPVLTITPGTQGLDVKIEVPNVSIDVTAAGTVLPLSVQGGFTATSISVEAVAAMSAGPTGALVVSFPTVNLVFNNFHLTLPGWLSWLTPIAEPLASSYIENTVKSMMQTSGAAAICKLVNNAATFSFGATSATFSYALKSISTDADGIAFTVDANLVMPPDPSAPSSPGSVICQGGLPTQFSKQPAIVLSLSQAMINRALHSAWQAGLLSIVMDPAQVNQAFGVALPFGSKAQDLVNFFPVLRGVIAPANLQAPLRYKISSKLPPTATFVSGVPDPLRLRFGEYDVTAMIDAGGPAPLEIFTVSCQAEIEVGVSIQNGQMTPVMTTLANPLIHCDLIAEPLVHLGAAHLESYIEAIVSMLMGGIVSRIPPIAVPALPAGLQLAGATFRVEGTSATYLTIELDLK